MHKQATLITLFFFIFNSNSVLTMELQPIHQASKAGNLKALKAFLRAGVDPNTYSPTRETPLHLATKAGNLNAVELLIHYGANIHAWDNKGKTPLSISNGKRNLKKIHDKLTSYAEGNKRKYTVEEIQEADSYSERKRLACHFLNFGGNLTVWASSSKEEIKIWEPTTGSLINFFSFKEHPEEFDFLTGLVFTPDGKKVISSHSDNSVKIFDLIDSSCKELNQKNNSRINASTFNAARTLRLSCSPDKNTVSVWNMIEDQPIYSIELPADELPAEKPGVELTYWSNNEQEIHIVTCNSHMHDYSWNGKTAELKNTFNFSHMLRGYLQAYAKHSPDESMVAFCGENNVEVRENGKVISTCNVKNDTTETIWYVRWNNKSNKLAIVQRYNVTLFDPKTKTSIALKDPSINKTQNGVIGIIEWSPDDTKIFTNCMYNKDSVKVWNSSTGELLYKIPVNNPNEELKGRHTRLTPDGSKIITYESDPIKTWDASTGKFLKEFKLPEGIEFKREGYLACSK